MSVITFAAGKVAGKAVDKALGGFIITAAADILIDTADCVIKNTLCDRVAPCRGSVIRVDLAGRQFVTSDLCHTGIYLGDDKVAELTSDDCTGKAYVRIVPLHRFLLGDGLFPRTGLFVYTACRKDFRGICRSVGSEAAARRAEEAAGKTWGKYALLSNNCHMFCRYCLTGERNKGIFTLSSVESELCRIGRTADICWRSTGAGRFNGGSISA